MAIGCRLPSTDPPPPPGTTLEPPSPLAGAIPPPPPGTTLDPPQAAQPGATAAPAQTDGKPFAQPSGAYDVPTQLTRAAGKAAIGIIDFIPDMLTYVYNHAPLTQEKDKLQMPSSYMEHLLDEALTPPQTTSQEIGEDVSAALLSGGPGSIRQAGTAVAKVAKTVAKPLTRIATRAAEEAHVAGYKLPPSYIGGTVTRSVQSVSGGPKLEKEFSKENAEVTDRLAKLALGLHPDEELTEETFEALKTKAYQPYEKVRALGSVPVDGQYTLDLMKAGGRFADRGGSFVGPEGETTRFPEIAAEKAPYFQERFDAGEAIDEIRMLRKLSRDNLKAYNPTANALGLTQREIANALENRMDRYAHEIGQDELLKEMRAARTQLAKIASVEDSMGVGGHVRAEDFRRMLDKGMPLSDSLLTIAETAKHFPRAVQELTAGEQGVFSAVDYLFGGSGMVTGHPAMAGPMLARPLSRWALKSEGAQKSMLSRLHKAPPGKVRQAASEAGAEAGKALKSGAGAALRGGTILGLEDLAEDLGDHE